VNHWIWDTMVTQHYLDNRNGVTSLKFQAFVRWGIPHYGLPVEDYLKSKDGSGFNKIKDAPMGTLLQYNGMDACFERWMMDEQMSEMESRNYPGSEPEKLRVYE